MAKPRGYFQYLLAIDCETTGLCFSSDSPVHNPKTGEHHQAVSWGMMVLDANTLDTVEELYVEIQWNELSCQQREDNASWGTYAEKVHGLKKSYLDKKGLDEEEAVVEIATLISKYFGPKSPIVTLGHNVHTFDMPFLRDQCRRHGIELRLANRHVDTNSIGFVNWQTYNSDDMFSLMGFKDREDHNALEDIRQTVDTVRVARSIMDAPVNQKVIEGLSQ